LSETHAYPANQDGRQTPIIGDDRRYDFQNPADQHPDAEELLSAPDIGDVAARHLRHYVTPEERAEHQILFLLIPTVILNDIIDIF